MSPGLTSWSLDVEVDVQAQARRSGDETVTVKGPAVAISGLTLLDAVTLNVKLVVPTGERARQRAARRVDAQPGRRPDRQREHRQGG